MTILDKKRNIIDLLNRNDFEEAYRKLDNFINRDEIAFQALFINESLWFWLHNEASDGERSYDSLTDDEVDEFCRLIDIEIFDDDARDIYDQLVIVYRKLRDILYDHAAFFEDDSICISVYGFSDLTHLIEDLTYFLNDSAEAREVEEIITTTSRYPSGAEMFNLAYIY